MLGQRATEILLVKRAAVDRATKSIAGFPVHVVEDMVSLACDPIFPGSNQLHTTTLNWIRRVQIVRARRFGIAGK